MMKKNISSFILFAVVLAAFSAAAQTPSRQIAGVQQKLSSSLESRFKSYPQEKVFVHASQSVFAGGQTVWYKVYAMAYGKPSALSKIAYVRLSDEKGRAIKQDKLPLKNGAAWGNIDLPDTLRSGWYRLQAFTAWMLNFNRDDLFTQVLYIQNPREPVNPDKFTVNPDNNYHITFYPEGGKLIDGATGNIAFKAVDGNGMPVTVNGEVLDGQKNKVTAISTIHDGMGSFSFETRAGMAYTAQVRFPDNSVQNIALPTAENTGISMRVNPGPPNEVDLVFATTGQQPETQNVLVQAVQDDGVAVGYPLQLSRGINVFSFDKNNFLTGIVHFGLFDESGRLVGERAVFIDHGDSPSATLKADTVAFKAGGANALTFNISDASGHPVRGDLSVSVTDADMGNAVSDNLGSFALLSSTTSAYIPDPGYYFKNNSDTLRAQLDLLMLTNQAHYAKWEDIINNKPISLQHAVQQSQFIAGRIEKYNPAQGLKIKMMITAADSGKVMAYVAPDRNGLFKLGNYNSVGNADVLYEAVNAKNRKQDAEVTFFNENLDTANTGKGKMLNAALANPGINISFIDSAGRALQQYYLAKGIMLKTVNIREHPKDPVQKMIDSHVKRFPADNAFTFDLVDLPGPPNQKILDYINGRIPGLVMTRMYDSIIWKYNGPSTLGIGLDPSQLPKPYFYIDEMYVDEDEVENMNMTDVAMIRFMPPPVWFAPLNGGFIGAIVIYTKTHDDDVNSYGGPHPESAMLNQFTFNGYSAPREFSAEHPMADKQRSGPGFRTTLFWAHDLQTDADGIVRVHFVANGKTKKYRVVLQGMDKDGHPIYLEKVFAAPVN
ncbi:MAG TPA: hypothetical protein VFE53_05380 [Mucilaginibacter sp.]|jgi:hypothetical protein|nr:hypothetical protein [Mucilaginibacter sp.]